MSPIRHRTALLATLTLGLALAGCGSSDDSAGDGAGDGPTTSASADVSPSASSTPPETAGPTGTPRDSPTGGASSSASATGPSPSAGAGSSPAPAPRCTTADLAFTRSGGEGAAGSTYYEIRMANRSSAPCRTGGFGGISLVGSPQGSPIGAPADRTRPGAVRQILLQPGARATTTLRLTEAGNYPRSTCSPRPATGLRVYPPDETRSAFVRLSATGCATASVHLLQLTPYRPAG